MSDIESPVTPTPAADAPVPAKTISEDVATTTTKEQKKTTTKSPLAPSTLKPAVASEAALPVDKLTLAVSTAVVSSFIRQEPHWPSIRSKVDSLQEAMKDLCEGDIAMEKPRTALAVASLAGLLDTSRSELNDRYLKVAQRAFFLADLLLA